MAEIKLTNGKAYCSQCSGEVEVREEKGDPNRDQKPFVLVDEHGHIIASATPAPAPGTAPPENAWHFGAIQ
jgi:hypothetical protein